MSLSLRRSVRFARRCLDLIALIGLAAAVGYTGYTVFAGRAAAADLHAATDRLESEAAELARRRPLRQVLGEPIPGNAVDDYRALCAEVPHRLGFLRPDSLAEVAALTAEQRAALESPRQLAAIDRFVRAARREDVAFGPTRCWMVSRPMAVHAAALVAAHRGAADLAWQRSMAVQAYAADTLGRAIAIEAMVASAIAAKNLDLIEHLATRATPEQAVRWHTDVDRILANGLPEEEIPIAFVVGESLLLQPEPGHSVAELAWRADAAEALVSMAEAGPDAVQRCRELHRGRFCEMLEEAVTGATTIRTRLAQIAIRLAHDRAGSLMIRPWGTFDRAFGPSSGRASPPAASTAARARADRPTPR